MIILAIRPQDSLITNECITACPIRFVFVMPSSALRIFPGIMCPTVIGAPGSYALQIGEVHTTMVLVRLFCMHRWHMCIARCRWFQIAFISCYFYPLNWDDDPKIDFCNFGLNQQCRLRGPKMYHLQREKWGSRYMVYWILCIGFLNCIHICIHPLSCLMFVFLSLH